MENSLEHWTRVLIMRAEEETANHNGSYPMSFALPLVKISEILGRNPEDLAFHEWVRKDANSKDS